MKIMKKLYFSPELEVIKIDPMVLSATSPDADTTDPVTVLPDDISKEAAGDEW
jgi:hypothetical protein